MTPEGRVEAHLVNRVKAEGGRTRKLRWIGRRGATDRIVWWPGPRLALVEVKTDDGRFQPGQEREIERMRADGFLVFVVRNFHDVEIVISRLTAPE